MSVAPMEGVTTFPYRLWLHMTSRPDAMTTPFLRVTQGQPGDALPASFAPELFQLRGVLPYSLAPQYIASGPDAFLRAAELLPEPVTPFVELNCGCPAPTALGKSAGSGILRDPDDFARTLERLATALGPRRFAVKMRVGYAAPEEFAALLPCVAALPLARLTVHGRTRADGYRGRARWPLIAEAARRASAPTWASGDVVDHTSHARLAADAPEAAGVAIGRGVLRNPWVFEELRHGAPVAVSLDALAHALLCFAMINELWISAPEKLLKRVASGRIGAFCGTDDGAWERAAADLTGLALGAPRVLAGGRGAADVAVSPTAFGRVRHLWAQLRGSLPEDLQAPGLARARTLGELFSQLFQPAGGSGQAPGARIMYVWSRDPEEDPPSERNGNTPASRTLPRSEA